MHRPLQTQRLVVGEAEPPGVHGVEHWLEWGGLSVLPGSILDVDDAFDHYECGVVRANDRMTARSGPAAGHTREPPTMREKSPEPVTNLKRALDRELRQVVWQI